MVHLYERGYQFWITTAFKPMTDIWHGKQNIWLEWLMVFYVPLSIFGFVKTYEQQI